MRARPHVTQRARALRKRNEWRKRLKLAVRGAKPNLLVEPIAAGEKVVVSQRSQTAKWIKKQYSDAVAVEMEGRGFLEAAHVHSTVAAVIRGISDLLSKKAASDKKGWQKRAADAASAVAFEMLHQLRAAQPSVPKKAPPPPAKPPAKPKYGAIKKPRQKRSNRTSSTAARGAAPASAPAVAVPVQPATPFRRTPYTLNQGAFFTQGEVLARVGVPRVDEVEFSFQELPDSFIRIIPRVAKAQPIPRSTLLAAARDAPLLKHRQYGGFSYLNRHGGFAYDPAGCILAAVPRRLHGARSCSTNGELWLMSNTAVVREPRRAARHGFRSHSSPCSRWSRPSIKRPMRQPLLPRGCLV